MSPAKGLLDGSSSDNSQAGDEQGNPGKDGTRRRRLFLGHWTKTAYWRSEQLKSERDKMKERARERSKRGMEIEKSSGLG